MIMQIVKIAKVVKWLSIRVWIDSVIVCNYILIMNFILLSADRHADPTTTSSRTLLRYVTACKLFANCLVIIIIIPWTKYTSGGFRVRSVFYCWRCRYLSALRSLYHYVLWYNHIPHEYQLISYKPRDTHSTTHHSPAWLDTIDELSQIPESFISINLRPGGMHAPTARRMWRIAGVVGDRINWQQVNVIGNRP